MIRFRVFYVKCFVKKFGSKNSYTFLLSAKIMKGEGNGSSFFADRMRSRLCAEKQRPPKPNGLGGRWYSRAEYFAGYARSCRLVAVRPLFALFFRKALFASDGSSSRKNALQKPRAFFREPCDSRKAGTRWVRSTSKDQKRRQVKPVSVFGTPFDNKSERSISSNEIRIVPSL